MRQQRTYFPVDNADLFELPPPPRAVPSFVVRRARRDRALALFLIAFAGGVVAMAFFARGWLLVPVAVVVLALGYTGWGLLRNARALPLACADGEVVLARVHMDMGQTLDEIVYVDRAEQVSISGQLGVFAGDPGTATVKVDYEFAGRVRHVVLNLSHAGKPLAVRVGKQVGCAVLVSPRFPEEPLLITEQLRRSLI